MKVGLPELRACALEFGVLRAGADLLFEAVRSDRIELVIASGGLDFYIDALLGEHRQLVRDVFCNTLTWTATNGWRFDRPFADPACPRCAVCKGRVVRDHLARGRRVAFCGDGRSDRCAIGVACDLFAVRGSEFARNCRESAVEYREFEDYREVLAALGALDSR